jgi:hypothetical protein
MIELRERGDRVIAPGIPGDDAGDRSIEERHPGPVAGCIDRSQPPWRF